MKITIDFQDLTPCFLVNKYQRFKRNHLPPKTYLCTRLHGVLSQKMFIVMITAMRSSNIVA